MNEKLTITELSAMFYMSEGSIRKYIREVSGLSFFDLLAEMRVTRHHELPALYGLHP